MTSFLVWLNIEIIFKEGKVLTSANVKRLRDMFHEQGVKVQIFGDNSNIYDERYDVVIWDDENEMVHVLQRTKTHTVYDYSRPEDVAYYTALEYDIIQYIQAVSDFNQFKKILPQLGSEDAERIENIIKWVGDTVPNRIVAKPGTRTEFELAKEVPELYNSVHGEGKAEEFVKAHTVVKE